MGEQRGVSQIASSLILAFILLAGTGLLFLKAGLFSPNNESTCSKEYLYLCETELSCNEIDFYWWDGVCHLNKEPEPKPSEYPDFDYYQSLKKFDIVTSTESWVRKDGTKEGQTYKRFIKVDGDISNAYLFIEASVDGGEPFTVWDSIYVSLRKVVNGYFYTPKDGHPIRGKSLKIPDSKITQLLYDFQKIPLTDTLPYSEDNYFINENWLSVLQGAKEFQFETFLSSLRKGEIHRIAIGYQCYEDSPGCKLSFSE